MENLFGLGLRPDQQVRAAPLRAAILFELCVCPTCVCVATLCVPSGWVRACVVAVSASVVACLRAVGLAEERRGKKTLLHSPCIAQMLGSAEPLHADSYARVTAPPRPAYTEQQVCAGR